MASGNVIRGMQKSRVRADVLEMSQTRRRCRLSGSVLAATLSLGLVACGEGDIDTGGAAVTTTVVADAPDRVSDQTEPAVADSSAFDEAENLFASTVGGNYVVTFEFVSQATAEAGPIVVEVNDGRAVDVTYPDAMTGQVLPQIPMLTVNDFFLRAQSVLADGGLIEVEFDEFYGHPLTMTLDPIPGAIDDELSIVVQSVEPIEVSFEQDGY